jgi:hypothetical protein
MPRVPKHESTTPHTRESSFVSLLTGWAQQGVENFFAAQRVLVDFAMRQNTSAMNFVRERLNDPAYRPAEVLTELASEGMSNFIEGQKLLLDLAQREYEIVNTGVKERVGGSTAAVAMTDLMRRGFDTFVEMQQNFLKAASKQTHIWLAAVTAGKGYNGEELVELARDSFDIFIRSQKKFLNLIAEETSNATNGKHGTAQKMKKTELLVLAREATDAFVDAQKKLIDVVDQQVNADLKATGRALNMITPFPRMPLEDLARDGVKSFVDAEKALIDTVTEHHGKSKAAGKSDHRKHPGRIIKKKTATAAHAHA